MIVRENIKETTTHTATMPGDHCQIEGNYIKEPHKFGIHFAQTHTATTCI